jgi:alkyl hydroperoxide reductase subunit AhpF
MQLLSPAFSPKINFKRVYKNVQTKNLNPGYQKEEAMEGEIYDVIVVGTGPAGLQAAIHAARRKVSVLVLGRQNKSSAYRAHIENYCCISGAKGAIELGGVLGVTLDSESMQYMMTNKKQETNIRGIYAAGDICGPPLAGSQGCWRRLCGWARSGRACEEIIKRRRAGTV